MGAKLNFFTSATGPRKDRHAIHYDRRAFGRSADRRYPGDAEHGGPSGEGQTESQTREYIDRAEETAETVETRVQALEERLNRND